MGAGIRPAFINFGPDALPNILADSESSNGGRNPLDKERNHPCNLRLPAGKP